MAASRSSYKHYENRSASGDVAFFTTTCLDFVHAFADPHIRSLMAASLIQDGSFYGAELHAFVIMPHHIHFIARVPEGKDSSWLAQRIKSNSARRILPQLAQGTLAQFNQQRGLNRRSFWRAGFREFCCGSVFWQKVMYIHNNPVRAGLCNLPEEYFWSSARYFVIGGWSESGLDLMAEEYANRSELESATRPSASGDAEG